MRRHLVILVSAASLMLCITTVALWVRSHRASDALGLSQRVRLFTDRGELVAFIVEPDSNFSWSLGYERTELPDPDETYNPRRMSKRTWSVLFAHGETFPGLRIVVVHFGAIFALGTLSPALLFTGLVQRQRRAASSLCAECGYDVRATPDRCPECGAVPAAAAAR